MVSKTEVLYIRWLDTEHILMYYHKQNAVKYFETLFGKQLN